MRRIILFSVILISLGAIGYTFFQSNSTTKSNSTALSYVSNDALMILEVEDALSFHDELQSGSVLWPVAMRIPGPMAFEELLVDIDSLLHFSYIQHPDSTYGYCLSLHPLGQQSRSWLLVIPKLLQADTDIAQALSQTGILLEKVKVYEQIDIYRGSKGEQEYFFVKKDDALIISTSELALERQLRNTKSIIEEPSFMTSWQTRSLQALAHLHVNWRKFGPHLELLLPGDEDPHFDRDLGDWATSDFITDANTIYLNGLIQVPDSLELFLEKFKSQGSGNFKGFLSIMPSNTSAFKYKHISDYSDWHPSLPANDTSIFNHLGAGMIELSIEGLPSISKVFKLKDDERTQTFLNERLKVIDVLGYKVYQGWIRQYSDLQDPSENDSLNYSVLLNGFLVVDSDLSNIKHLLLQFKSNRTLENDDSFLELRGNLDDKASLLYYYNLARLSDNLANKEFGFPFERISSANEELKKFQALVLQYEPAGDNTFHQQVFLRHNPVYKKEASSIWELVLDRPIINDIHGLKNHYNNEYEVLVQDDSLSIHLIDNRGQILWSRSLPDPILSKVEQIDIYKNGKLQIIFNTSNSIYAIDRNGRDVDGFPVMLPSTASTLLAIMDYDKSRNYRLMIGLEDGRLMNYGVDGKAIKGWKYEPKDLPLIGHLIHFAIGKKDYICTIKSDGKLEFLGRNGKVRYGGAKVSLPSYDGGFYRIRPGKNIESTSIVHRNEQGELLLSKVSGSSEIIDEKALIHTQKPDRFYRVENGKYTLINSKYETRLEISTEIEDLGIELDSDLFTGLVDHMSGLFYLYDNSGELLQGFPLPGKNSYIGDMNKDGIKDIVLSDNQGVLYMYALD